MDENNCRLHLDQSLDAFDDRCTEGKGHKDSVAYAAIAQAHALCRIADALEKLAAKESGPLPPRPCSKCQGPGAFEISDVWWCQKCYSKTHEPPTNPYHGIRCAICHELAGSHHKLSCTVQGIVMPGGIFFTPDREQKPRCPECQGTGLFHGLGTFCSCQTGKDLEAQQKRMGHLEA